MNRLLAAAVLRASSIVLLCCALVAVALPVLILFMWALVISDNWAGLVGSTVLTLAGAALSAWAISWMLTRAR